MIFLMASFGFFFFGVGMANIMILTRPADSPEGSPPVDQSERVSSPHDSENLSDVEADVSELMALEKQKNLKFGPSLVSQSLINLCISKGYFVDSECRPPGDEVTHVLEEGEVLIFRDFFVAGMRFP